MAEVLVRMWQLVQARVDADLRGQTTAEYALLLVAVAAIVGVLISWAGGSGMLDKLFGSVIDTILPG